MKDQISNSEVAAGIEELDKVADEMDAEDGVAGETDAGADDVEETDDQGAEGEDVGEETDDDDLDDEEDPDDLDDEFDDDDEVEGEGEGEGEGEVEEAPEAITREDGATWDHDEGKWRDKSGKFVDGEPPTKEQIAAAAATAAAGKADAGAGEKTDWGELSVTVNRKPFVIPEAGVMFRKGSDGKEYAFVAVPKDQFPQFTNRIMRGIHAQQVSKELDARIRDLEQLRTEMEEERKLDHPAGAAWDLEQAVWKNAQGQVVPGRPPSDAEIEARIYLEELKKKGSLEDIFELHEIANMELRQKLAIKEAREKFATYETGRQTSRTEATAAEQAQVDGVEATVLEIAEAFPEFKGLTHEHLVEVFNELLPFRRAIFWRDGDGWMKNTQSVYDALKRKAKSLEDGSGAPAPKPAADKAKPGKATAGDRNERFNEGQRTAAKPKKPGTTSVKAQRDANQRPVNRAATREERRRGKGKVKGTSSQRAEAKHRGSVRTWMNSDSLDFPD